jgi:hypothetical protein
VNISANYEIVLHGFVGQEVIGLSSVSRPFLGFFNLQLEDSRGEAPLEQFLPELDGSPARALCRFLLPHCPREFLIISTAREVKLRKREVSCHPHILRAFTKSIYEKYSNEFGSHSFGNRVPYLLHS